MARGAENNPYRRSQNKPKHDPEHIIQETFRHARRSRRHLCQSDLPPTHNTTDPPDCGTGIIFMPTIEDDDAYFQPEDGKKQRPPSPIVYCDGHGGPGPDIRTRPNCDVQDNTNTAFLRRFDVSASQGTTSLPPQQIRSPNHPQRNRFVRLRDWN